MNIKGIKKWLWVNWKYWVSGLVLVLIVAAGIYFGSGRYPIAMVNNRSISAQDFRAAYSFAKTSGDTFLRMYNPTSTKDVAQLSDKDLEIMVMDELVEDSLVHQEFIRQVGREAGPLLAKKVLQYERDPSFMEAAKQVLGVNLNDLQNMVLLPQAERDLLSGRLYLHGKNVEDWIKEARGKAQVSVFSNNMHWQDGRMVMGKGSTKQ